MDKMHDRGIEMNPATTLETAAPARKAWPGQCHVSVLETKQTAGGTMFTAPEDSWCAPS